MHCYLHIKLSSGTGIHPQITAKLKLLSKEVYEIFSNILQAEFQMFLNDEVTSDGRAKQSVASSNHVFEVGKNIFCNECSTSYQHEMRQKFIVLEVNICVIS